MTDLNPPPLFPPVNAGGDAADSGGMTITHGEVPRQVVGSEIVPYPVHLHADPDPHAVDTQSPSLPNREPKWVRHDFSSLMSTGSLILSP